MPGLLGLCSKEPAALLSSLVERMAKAVTHGEGYQTTLHVAEPAGLAFGRAHLGVFNADRQPLTSEDGSATVLVHGELFGDRSGKSDPERILELYLARGDDWVLDVTGSFSALVYDAIAGKLKIFNDRFGLSPLYFTETSRGDFVFCTEVKGVLSVRGVDRTRDDRAIADCFAFGYPLGLKSLFRSITLQPPGSVLTYDLAERRLVVSRYYDYHDLFAPKGWYDEKMTLDEVVDRLVEAVRARTSTHRDVLGLSLSGGLDTRSILAAMGGDARGIASYTLGLKGCQDETFAAGIARVAGTSHEFVELGQAYLCDYSTMADDMVHLSDGMFFPHESTEMLACDYFRTGRFRVLLRGHGGEMAKASLAYPVMIDDRTLKITRRADIFARLYNSVALVSRDIDLSELFSASYYPNVRDAAFASLQEAVGRAADVMNPADVGLFYYLDAYVRRFGVSSLSIFRSQVEIRMPYVDHLFLDALLKMPIKKRWEGEIHHALIRRCQPEMMKVPSSHTGAPLDAHPLRIFVTDKVVAVLRKLSVTGFKHYTEFQTWQREQFRDHIAAILFSELTADRGIFNMPVLRNYFERHMSGASEHAHLLGTAVGIELWHRKFVDGQPAAEGAR